MDGIEIFSIELDDLLSAVVNPAGKTLDVKQGGIIGDILTSIQRDLPKRCYTRCGFC